MASSRKPGRARTQPSSTGRIASAGIAARLRDALASGRALTYAELAADVGCSERTVRNYLDVAESAFGLRIERERGPDRVVRARVGGGDDQVTMQALAHNLAVQMLRSLFPVAGTSFERPKRRSRAQVVVSARGAYRYSERQLRLLRAWLRAADERCRVAVRFRYGSFSSGPGERIVWPLGIVVRDLARVYLMGVPAEAEDARDVRSYALERAETAPRGQALAVLRVDDAETPPHGIDRAVVEHAIDLPFSMFPPDTPGAVTVRVRFSAEQAPYVVGRTWHRKQRFKKLRGGGVEMTFGPAERTEVDAWLRQWGRGVTKVEVQQRAGLKRTSR
jgi:predicted DNA-binding transcriptional regulator YafY